MSARPPPEAWAAFADALLQREALRCRVGEGLPPRDFAGLYVDHADVDRILSQLPGLDGPAPEAAEPVLAAVAPHVEAARSAFHAALRTPGRFADVVRTARLSPEEAEVLAVVAAVELAPQRQRLVAYIQDSVNLPRLALATLPRLFPAGHAGAKAVAPASRLCRSGLVAVEPEGPWATRMVSLAPRLAWALVGDRSPDPGLPHGAERVERADLDTGGAALVLVPGADRVSRRQAAVAACAGAAFLVSPEPATAEGWLALVREATVEGLGVVVELEGDLPPAGCAAVAAADHLAWGLCSPRELPLGSLPERPWVERSVPTAAADADGHRLTPEQRELVVRAHAGEVGDLDAAVRRLASGLLDGLAVRVRPGRGWADLVVPADQQQQLRELASRYRHRRTVYERWGFATGPSTGLVAAFAGPSGTGKTLAAEVLAGELGLDLYKVDLSAVVSKYIGETEKNLERIFSAAAAGNVVLFFDEADALFGKRSEVGDAHDRYANIEVSYLLQRLETYDGVVVLATNLQGNMDQAFLRRLDVAVDFPLPDEEQRRAIWERSFPPRCPRAGLDLAFLARQFKLSGGSIRNAAHGAAFLAAERGTAVSMDLVMLALKREFQKLGRLRTEAEFDRYFELVMT